MTPAVLARAGKESAAPPAAPPAPRDGHLLAACRLVGARQGIAFRAGAAETVPALAAASGVRCRAVTLRDGWWRAESGPLLGFRAGRAVALLPARGGRYLLADPATGERIRVTGAVAAALEERAWIFQTPLPRRPLAARDLLRAGIRAVRGEGALVLAAGAAGGALALAAPLATARLVGAAIPAGDRPQALWLLAALVASAAAAALFHLLRAVAVLRLEAKLDHALQGGVWDHLLSLPVSFFRRYGVGDLHARASGVETIRAMVSGHVLTSALALVFSLFSFALLFRYSPPLAAVAALLVAALGAATLALARRQLGEERRLEAQRGRIASLLYDLLAGIHKLRAAGAEGRAHGVWSARYAEQRATEARSQRIAAAQTTVNAAYALLAPLTVFAVVGATGGAGMDIGAFLAFNVAFGQFQAAVFAALSVAAQCFAAVPVYERLRPILAAAPEVGELRADPGVLRGDLELRGVAFRYAADGPPVLDGVTITARAGEMVALVGASGSGKSTCLRLLLGFERPDAGAVRVDGRDLGELDLHAYRRQVGVVLQDGQPLVGTILENIVGSRDLTVDDAWEAARRMGLEAEIRALPMGMFTFVGDRGTTFSGGQRQRMLLARAVAARPRLLLLDEATSALDNRTQEHVVGALGEMGVTRIVVAHRLSTVRRADRIYVLEGGRVVECGSFEELAGRGGVFSRMVGLQQA